MLETNIQRVKMPAAADRRSCSINPGNDNPIGLIVLPFDKFDSEYILGKYINGTGFRLPNGHSVGAQILGWFPNPQLVTEAPQLPTLDLRQQIEKIIRDPAYWPSTKLINAMQAHSGIYDYQTSLIDNLLTFVQNLPNFHQPVMPENVTTREQFVRYILTIHGISESEILKIPVHIRAIVNNLPFHIAMSQSWRERPKNMFGVKIRTLHEKAFTDGYAAGVDACMKILKDTEV